MKVSLIVTETTIMCTDVASHSICNSNGIILASHYIWPNGVVNDNDDDDNNENGYG